MAFLTLMSRVSTRPIAHGRLFGRPNLEELESRALLSTSGGLTAMPLYTATPEFGPGSNGYTPAQIRHFNRIDQTTLTGQGETIAIVTAFNAPTIVNDLEVFDRTFGLPGQSSADIGSVFTKLNQSGQAGNYPPTSRDWAGEAALDVEWAHAIAPGAKIVLVESNTDNFPDLMSGVNTARNLAAVNVVSMSWGGTEFTAETAYDSILTTPAGRNGITFIASSGDTGAGVIWPAVSPNVLSVGGTTLYGNGNEIAWSGSGGGVSQYETEPGYQSNEQQTGKRADPDVSFNADPSTGVSVYNSYGGGGWTVDGGTSAGAPQWAGIIALADQFRGYFGMSSIANAQAFLANLSGAYFRDVTYGSNGAYSANTGYDLVTGRGSPQADWIAYASAYIPYINFGGSWANGTGPSSGGAGGTGGGMVISQSPVASESVGINALVSALGPINVKPIQTDLEFRTDAIWANDIAPNGNAILANGALANMNFSAHNATYNMHATTDNSTGDFFAIPYSSI